MAVGIDAKGTVLNGTSLVLTTGNYTGLTVGATANGLLVVLVLSPRPAAAPTVTWDSGGTNQAMTLIGTAVDSTNLNANLYFYGLINPTSGNKTLVATWVTTSARFIINAISFTGMASTLAAAFTNYTNTDNTTASTSFNQALTLSNPGNDVGLAVMSIAGSTAVSTRSDTLWFNDSAASVPATDAQTAAAPTGSSHTFNWVIAVSNFTLTAAVEVSPSAGGAGLVDGTMALNRKQQRRPSRTGSVLLASPPPTVAAPPPVAGSTLPMMGVG